MSFKSALFTTLGSIGGIVLSFVPFMAILGMVAILLGEIWSKIFLGISLSQTFQGDKMWPAAFFTNAIIAVAVLPAISLLSWYFAGPLNQLNHWIIFTGILLLWASVSPIIVLKLQQFNII